MANELNSERRADAKFKQLALHRTFQMHEFIQGAMRISEGRVFFYELLAMCKIGVNPFNGHALGTAFNCGERNIGDQVQDLLTRLCPENYLLMLKEQQELQNGRFTPDTNTGDDSADAGREAERTGPTGPFDA